MALLVRGTSRCSVCHQVLLAEDRVVGFRAFLPSEHPLWCYSDSAMHAACFEAWPHREEFAKLHAAATGARRSPERNEVQEARARADREHNENHRRLMRVVLAVGAACPHCGTHSAAYREIGGTARLRLVCLTCRRSCDAAELHVD